MEVVFYALYSTPFDKALPTLLQKIYDSSLKVHIFCENNEQLQTLDDSIWTFTPLAFLPHASVLTSIHFPEKNPIWLATDAKFINDPDIMISTVPTFFENLENIKKIMFFYDTNLDSKDQFEKLQKSYIQKKYNVLSWIQNAKGGWDKKTI
jgi:DNA polymerase-3 subunit chi